jgi:hypothetical protein
MDAGRFAHRFNVDPGDSMDEPWLMVGMLPGFLCGGSFALWSKSRMAVEPARCRSAGQPARA